MSLKEKVHLLPFPLIHSEPVHYILVVRAFSPWQDLASDRSRINDLVGLNSEQGHSKESKEDRSQNGNGKAIKCQAFCTLPCKGKTF